MIKMGRCRGNIRWHLPCCRLIGWSWQSSRRLHTAQVFIHIPRYLCACGTVVLPVEKSRLFRLSCGIPSFQGHCHPQEDGCEQSDVSNVLIFIPISDQLPLVVEVQHITSQSSSCWQASFSLKQLVHKTLGSVNIIPDTIRNKGHPCFIFTTNFLRQSIPQLIAHDMF